MSVNHHSILFFAVNTQPWLITKLNDLSAWLHKLRYLLTICANWCKKNNKKKKISQHFRTKVGQYHKFSFSVFYVTRASLLRGFTILLMTSISESPTPFSAFITCIDFSLLNTHALISHFLLVNSTVDFFQLQTFKRRKRKITEIFACQSREKKVDTLMERLEKWKH